MFIQYNENNTIIASSDHFFPNSVQVDFDVVRGHDGKLYKSGEEPQGPTPEELLLRQLRLRRDVKLTDTDKYLLADYPIRPEELVAIKTYRQALRDLPAQLGAPWDGGGELTPWPIIPEMSI